MVIELTPRQESIFTALLREYTRRGEPIGSEEIASERNISASPATIRWELLRLQNKGLLAQPHRSAGRTPTVKGYRFFVDCLLEPQELSGREKTTLDELVSRFEEQQEELIEASLLELSHFTHAVSIFSGNGHIHSAGSGELSHEKEFHGTILGRFLELLDELEGRRLAEPFLAEIENPVEIFIGNEHPLLRRAHGKVSLVAGRCQNSRGGVLGLIGPTRMDYAHNRAVVEYLVQSLSDINE